MEAEHFPQVVCPHCRGDLAEGSNQWSCLACAYVFPALRGIPDLRVADDEYLANADDWAWAKRLDEEYDRLDFAGLLEKHYEMDPETPPDLRARQIEHIRTAPDRAKSWLDHLGDSTKPIDFLLDLGCGSGSFLEVAALPGRCVWGIDIAMRWLMIARKRLDQAGLSQVRLVCGNAEKLPFRDQSWDAIVAGDVIEHVQNQAQTLAEAYRTLRSQGQLVMATPNRFSLAPEPHVQVWGVGWLPRSRMAPYVRWTRGLDFRAIRTLGFSEWRRIANASPFRTLSIRSPGLPQADLDVMPPFKRRLATVYNKVVRTSVGQCLALWVGPLFHIVGKKD